MNMIRIDSYLSAKKSGSRWVKVMVEGFPIVGLIHTGSDITLMRGDQFYDMVKDSLLSAHHLKPTEQRACTYDQKPITFDGQIDVKIAFGKKAKVSIIFVKLVAPDKLLLSENVCRMLSIVSYQLSSLATTSTLFAPTWFDPWSNEQLEHNLAQFDQS